MLTKVIEFEDYNGEKRSETHYFNLSKSEIGEMQFTTPGGLEAHIKRIIECQDTVQIYSLFKEIIAKSYGEKSSDGKYFRKKAPDGHLLFDDFEATAAYDTLFMDLITNEDTMSAFINGLVPSDLAPTVEDQI